MAALAPEMSAKLGTFEPQNLVNATWPVAPRAHGPRCYGLRPDSPIDTRSSGSCCAVRCSGKRRGSRHSTALPRCGPWRSWLCSHQRSMCSS